MLAWSEGTDNGRQKTRNHGYDVIVGGELFTDYSDHPRKLVTLNLKLKSTGAGRYQLLSCWWDAYCKQLGLKDFPKSQDAVALQQIKERGALPMIDRGDIRQAIDRCRQYLGFTAGRWLSGCSSIRPTAWLQNSKKWAERSERLMYEQSRHDYLRLVICITGRLPRAVNHYRYNAVPLPTKPATKMPENWSWRTRQLLTCRCVSVMLLRFDAKYTKELADAKAENDALRDDVAYVVGCTIVLTTSASKRAPRPEKEIMRSPRQTPLNGIISPSERGWSLCKNNWKENLQKYINEQCR